MSVLSPSKTASFARPYWNAATCYGTAHATTTFHEQHNKRDYVYSYGRCSDEFVRQDGKRGLALGYLTKVRFTRFLTTPLATELTGLDLTRPGQGATQAARVVAVADAFFGLLVRYSHSHPYRDGDYGNVMRSRALPRNSFCIFTGFAEALASPELETLRAEWRARYPPATAPSLHRLHRPCCRQHHQHHKEHQSRRPQRRRHRQAHRKRQLRRALVRNPWHVAWGRFRRAWWRNTNAHRVRTRVRTQPGRPGAPCTHSQTCTPFSAP